MEQQQKMKEITKYEAPDGSQWATVEDCSAREKMVAEVDAAMANLKPKPKDPNWDGYVQQSRQAVGDCLKALYRIANKKGVLKWWIDSQKKDHGKTDFDFLDCHPSWFERMLDGDHEPLSRAYGRMSAINEEYKEWNQPYFAMNAGTGEDVCVG